MKTTLWVVTLMAVTALACFAQESLSLNRSSVNCGGGQISGGALRLNSSIGQSASGLTGGASALHWVGFWAGEVPTPVAVNGPGAAKLLPDAAFVSIAGSVATCATGDFSEFFYIEKPDRSSGIRVAARPDTLENLVRGSIVNVIGSIGTAPSGERQFTGPIVVVQSKDRTPGPLGMPNRSVGGGDMGNPTDGLGQYGVTGGTGPNNVGLLVRTWGRVIDVDAEYLMIDDGSSTPVHVSKAALLYPPRVDDYVTVIGVSSLRQFGTDRVRTILPRTVEDLTLAGKE